MNSRYFKNSTSVLYLLIRQFITFNPLTKNFLNLMIASCNQVSYHIYCFFHRFAAYQIPIRTQYKNLKCIAAIYTPWIFEISMTGKLILKNMTNEFCFQMILKVLIFPVICTTHFHIILTLQCKLSNIKMNFYLNRK